jgi:peptide/nickel transport system substrate-binding protein
MDESRPELLESNIKGRNPFKDKRVRQAFTEAIDEDAIAAKIMRGYAHPTALMVGPGVRGYDAALDKRFPYDPAAAKKLLAEAGYADGFELGMDCPTDRYVNDEAICQAVVAMLARIGIRVDLLAQTRAKFFAKVNAPRYDTSFLLLGWTPGTYDALDTLNAVAATRDPATKAGLANLGGYSNPKIDDLVRRIQVELDPDKRQALIDEALTILKDDFVYIPLHQQVVVWASRDNVDLVQGGDDSFQLRYLKLN